MIRPVLMTALLAAATPAPDSLQLNEGNIPQIVEAMTLKEKATLLVGSGFKSMLAGNLGEKGVLVPGAAGTTRAIPRLGIPAVVLSDGPAGVRINPTRKRSPGKTFYATAFPTGTVLASTWNEDMLQEVGSAMGSEALEYGIDVLLGPGMNLMRNPLNGRNFEYYSEDPVLAGKMAAAMIRGIQSRGVGTSAKHFALNNQETNRAGNDARVDDKTARELYLKGFEIAVREAAPWTLMSSYNKINGEYAQSNRWLLTRVLREEWDFGGLVMSDWTGKRDTGAQVAAGNDLMEPGLNSQIREIVRQVRRGVLTESEVDACVTRVLELVVKTPRFREYAYSEEPDLQAHALVAREAAAEGIVLLRNEGVLPFGGDVSTVAVFGVAGYSCILGGTGSGHVNAAHAVQLPDALQARGITAEPALRGIYENYLARNRVSQGMLGAGIPAEFAVDPSPWTGADAAVFVIGRQAGESGDRHVEDDFLLTDIERANLEAISSAFRAAGKKVIVVLNIGGVIETASWKDLADAIVLSWQPGEEGFAALAGILCGETCPSGRLPMTFPIRYSDVPSSENFPYNPEPEDIMGPFKKHRDRGRPNVDFTEYAEKLGVGYRYFSTAGKEVSYPFGFGLSYTVFSYDSISAAVAEDGSAEVRVCVTNRGNAAGKEVVQVYLARPEAAVPEAGAPVTRPALELKGFAKTSLLAPGESQTVTVRIAPYILASFDAESGSWSLPQEPLFLAGPNCAELPLSAGCRDL